MQPAVKELVKLGALPSTADADVEKLAKFQTLLTTIQEPISSDDARALVKLFGPDDCFGLAWALLHVVETAPSRLPDDALQGVSPEWAKRLKQRQANR